MKPDEIITLYKSGSYGSPEAPIRSSSPKSMFWAGYFGYPAPAKNTINRTAYDAGVIVRKMKNEIVICPECGTQVEAPIDAICSDCQADQAYDAEAIVRKMENV